MILLPGDANLAGSAFIVVWRIFDAKARIPPATTSVALPQSAMIRYHLEAAGGFRAHVIPVESRELLPLSYRRRVGTDLIHRSQPSYSSIRLFGEKVKCSTNMMPQAEIESATRGFLSLRST